MTIEIVDFPIENGGSFHSFLYVYQRVTINHGLTPPMENGFQMGLPLVYLTPFMLMGIPWNNGISPSTLRHHGLTPSNGQWYTKQQWDFPINHGRPPSDVRGCRFTCAGGVSSREQFVSGALSVIPSTTRVLYLYDVVWDLPEKWVFQTSSSFQARILCGWSFFFRWLLDFDRSAVRRWMIMMVELEITYYTDYTLSIKWISPSLPSVSRVSLLFVSRITCSWVWLVRSYTNRAACGFFNDQDSSIFQSMIVLMAFTSVPCATSRSSTLQSLQRQTFNGLANIRTMKLA